MWEGIKRTKCTIEYDIEEFEKKIHSTEFRFDPEYPKTKDFFEEAIFLTIKDCVECKSQVALLILDLIERYGEYYGLDGTDEYENCLIPSSDRYEQLQALQKERRKKHLSKDEI